MWCNVGDTLTHARSGQQFVVKHVLYERERYSRVVVTCSVDGSERIGSVYHANFTVTPANPNLVTVSSLDYMTNEELDDDDKEIIRAAIQSSLGQC